MTYNRGKGRAIPWLTERVNYDGAGCLIWPFATARGYGQFQHEGAHYKAHRYMCELVHGPAPSPAHEASHSCGNGHLACVHPKHIAWKTKSENQRDRARHGTATTAQHGRRQKLTPQQAAYVRSSRTRITHLAVRFGVDRATIYKIRAGQTYRDGLSRGAKLACNYPNCDGGHATGYCHNDCRDAHGELADKSEGK